MKRSIKAAAHFTKVVFKDSLNWIRLIHEALSQSLRAHFRKALRGERAKAHQFPAVPPPRRAAPLRVHIHAAVHSKTSCFIGVRFLSVWHEMAPVIGCRRRPILGPTRTSYKFRDEGNTHILFTRFARSSISEAADREDKTGYGRAVDDSRRSGHMRHTNHSTDAADPWMRPWLVDPLNYPLEACRVDIRKEKNFIQNSFARNKTIFQQAI